MRNNSKDDAGIVEKLVTKQQIAGTSKIMQINVQPIGNRAHKMEDVTTTVATYETKVTSHVLIVERMDITNPNVPNVPKTKTKE